MSIDPNSETIITLGEACRAVPPKGVSLPTMSRWMQHAPRGGEPLETILIGGRRYTSREALSRFFAQQNASESPSPAITAKQRRTQAEAANRLLQEAGI